MHEALARAWSLHQAGEREAAERAYRELLAREPGQGDALNCFGILLMQTGRAGEALANFRAAVASDATQASFRLNVARAALRLGRAEIALEAAYAAHAIVSSANAWLLRGAALRDLDRVAEARDVFERGARDFPDDVALRFNLGVGELDTGDAAAAARVFESLLQAHPNEARAWIGLGNAHAALDATQRVSSARQTPLQPGESTHARTRLDDAQRAYERATQLAPNQPEAWRLLGLTLIQRGRPREAIDALRRGLQRDPRDQAALAALGVAAVQAGDPVASVLLDFDRVVDVAPMPFDGDMPLLAQEILAHPSLRYDRQQKTTRDGGQTANLVDATTPQLAAFVHALRDALATRIARAAQRYAQDGHPLAGTEPRRWHLNVWATVLNQQGRQAPHLHPSGWMSGVHYVALPEVGENSQDGWIEFGIPPEELAAPEAMPHRRLQPRVGALVTFPSCLYHRTVPHASAQPRISLAFDVIPGG